MAQVGIDYATEAVAYDLDDQFTTEANFNLYDPKAILTSYLGSVNDKKRLILEGYFSFQSDQPAFKTLLDNNSILYDYDNTLATEHSWEGGWLDGIIANLFTLRGA